MKKIIISLTLAAFVAAPMESIAQNTQNQSKSLFDVMMRHQQENKDKKTSDKKTIAKGKTTVKKNMTNREYAAATDIWLNTSAPDAPAVVNNSQRQLFIKCMMQAIGHGAPSGDIVRLASQDEVNYGKNNSYLSTSNSSHIYFVYRGYWEKDIQRKSGLALFGEKIN